MAIAKTNLERQQRTANLFAAGNLWYQRKSSIALEKVAQMQTKVLEQHQITNAKLTNINNNIKQLGRIAEAQLRELRLQTARQEKRDLEEDIRRTIKKNEDKEMAFRRDAFFHLMLVQSLLLKSGQQGVTRMPASFSISACDTWHMTSGGR